MINPLKKKIKIHAELMGLLDMANKVDELVKVLNAHLQAKEEASKGECDCICHTYKLPIKGSPEHFCCEKLDPPEHEESCCCYSYKHGITPCLCGCHKKD